MTNKKDQVGHLGILINFVVDFILICAFGLSKFEDIFWGSVDSQVVHLISAVRFVYFV